MATLENSLADDPPFCPSCCQPKRVKRNKRDPNLEEQYEYRCDGCGYEFNGEEMDE
jgi:transposase-like protein